MAHAPLHSSPTYYDSSSRHSFLIRPACWLLSFLVSQDKESLTSLTPVLPGSVYSQECWAVPFLMSGPFLLVLFQIRDLCCGRNGHHSSFSFTDECEAAVIQDFLDVLDTLATLTLGRSAASAWETISIAFTASSRTDMAAVTLAGREPQCLASRRSAE